MRKLIGAGAIVVVSGVAAFALMGGSGQSTAPKPMDVTATNTRAPDAVRVFAASTSAQPTPAREPDLIAKQLDTRASVFPPPPMPPAPKVRTANLNAAAQPSAQPQTVAAVKPASTSAPKKTAKKKAKSAKAATKTADKPKPATAAAPTQLAQRPALN